MAVTVLILLGFRDGARCGQPITFGEFRLSGHWTYFGLSVGANRLGLGVSVESGWRVGCQIMWFWLKFRQAGGWLIAARIHNRLAGCTGTGPGPGPGTSTPDAAAASCRKRAASGPSEHARPPSRNLSQNPVSGTFLASYLAVLGDLFGRPAVFARLARTIVRKSGHLACKDPAR